MADLDISALWSWIIPLWSIFLIVAFLGGVLISPIALQHVRISPIALQQDSGSNAAPAEGAPAKGAPAKGASAKGANAKGANAKGDPAVVKAASAVAIPAA